MSWSGRHWPQEQKAAGDITATASEQKEHWCSASPFLFRMPAHGAMLPMCRFVFYRLVQSGYPLQKCLEMGLLDESRYCQVDKINDYTFKIGDATDEINNVDCPMDNKWHSRKEGHMLIPRGICGLWFSSSATVTVHSFYSYGLPLPQSKTPASSPCVCHKNDHPTFMWDCFGRFRETTVLASISQFAAVHMYRPLRKSSGQTGRG